MATKTDIINLALSKLGSERLTLTDSEITDNTLSHAKTVNLHYTNTLDELVRMHKWNCCKLRNRLGAFEINIAIGSTITAQGGFSGDLSATGTDSNGRPTYTTGTSATNGYVNLVYDDTNSRWSLTLGYGGGNQAPITLSSTTYNPNGDYNSGSSAATGATITVVKPDFEYSYQHRLPTGFIRTSYVTNTSEVYYYGKSKVYYSIEGNALLSNEENIYLCYSKAPEPENMDSLFQQAFVVLLAARMAVPITGELAFYKLLLEEFNNVIMPEARRANAFEKQDAPEVDSEYLESTYTSGSSISNSRPPFSQTSYGSFS
jgi:hypothetical protein